MDFRFTDEQDMITRTLEDALADICTTGHLRSMIERGRTHDCARWNTLADLGICGALVPEAAGGLDLGEVVMCRIAQNCGAALLPEPMIGHAGIALPLAHELAEIRSDDALRGLVAGDGHAVLFHPEQPFANSAQAARLVICVDGDGEIFIGAPDAFALTPQPVADPLGAVASCRPGSAATRLARSDATDAALACAVSRGILFCAAELLGVALAVLDLSVAYAKVRHQFGRAIGSNQAIKHMLADVQVQISFLHPVVYAAAALFDRNDVFAQAQISHAWLRATGVADQASRTVVQVHGAMGYSWETDVHFSSNVRSSWRAPGVAD